MKENNQNIFGPAICIIYKKQKLLGILNSHLDRSKLKGYSLTSIAKPTRLILCPLVQRNDICSNFSEPGMNFHKEKVSK